ncbi:PLP-dependent transferase, partial [Listeria monocytogenes]
VGRNIYGGTYSLFNEYFADRGLLFDAVDTADPEALDAAVSGSGRGSGGADVPPAKAVYFETLTNPLIEVNNVRAISAIAHRYG